MKQMVENYSGKRDPKMIKCNLMITLIVLFVFELRIIHDLASNSNFDIQCKNQHGNKVNVVIFLLSIN